jgi:hypothetical protein
MNITMVADHELLGLKCGEDVGVPEMIDWNILMVDEKIDVFLFG